MARLRPRRPSAALVVALLALFVAVGGPAEAARLIGSKDVKNRSLKTEDLSKKAVRTLRATPPNSIGSAAGELRDGAITPVKLAPAAIGSAQLAQGAVGTRELRAGAAGSAQIADGAVTGAKVADGSLDARDSSRFSGRFRVTVPAVAARDCWSGEPVGLARGAGRAPTSPATSCSRRRTARGRSAASPSRSAGRRTSRASCSRAATSPRPRTTEVEVGFRYVVIDLP